MTDLSNVKLDALAQSIDGLGLHGGRALSPDEFVEIPSAAAKCKVLAGFLGFLAAGASGG